MAKVIQLRRGTTTAHSAFTGKVGEVTVDTDKDTLVVHDGTKAGGYPLQRADQKISSAANADTSTKLKTARTIRTNLASTSTASFDGTGNVTPGVTGTLGTGNGGTGRTDGKAVAWATARTISLGGDASGSVSVDGSKNVTLTATVKNSSTSDDAQGILQAFIDFAEENNIT